MSSFDVGVKYTDFKSLEAEIEQFEKENFVKLSKSDCRKIKAARSKYPSRQFKEELVYAELKLCCHHGGKKLTSRSRGERPNQTTGKLGCPFTIRFRATSDGQFLEVVSRDLSHNYQVTELEYKYHPKVRKVDLQTEKEIAQHLQFHSNRKLVQQSYAEKTGKKIILKDIHNIATRMKASDSIPAASAAQGLYDWLKEEHPSLFCDFVVKEDTLSGIYMQDAEMFSTFQSFAL